MKLLREFDHNDCQTVSFYASGHFRVKIVLYVDSDEISCKVEVANMQTLGQWTDLGWIEASDFKGRKTKKAFVQRALEWAVQFIDGE